MRTSTAVFLIIFLCLFSSSDQRSDLRGFAANLAERIHHILDTGEVSLAEEEFGDEFELDEMRRLRDMIREIEQREQAADKSTRAIDRSVRSLDDRIRKIETEAAARPRFGQLVDGSLEMLRRQRVELQMERDEISVLKDRMEGEIVRLQSEMELRRIQGERRRVEAFLGVDPNSPMDELAGQGSW